MDKEEVKLLLEEWSVSSGVRLLYHTRVVGGHVENGRLTHVITENKSGRQAIKAKVFIDATGDGDLAALIGCDFDYGYPTKDNKVFTQPMTLCAIVAGPDQDLIRPFVRGLAESDGESAKKNLNAEPKRSLPLR
jgi:glycine/D-amino acid oxidase-like deaminating enzyme